MSGTGTRANTKVFFLDLKQVISGEGSPKWRWWDIYPTLGATEPPNPEHVEVLKLSPSEKGSEYWNSWRRAHPSEKPSLSGLRFPTRFHDGQPQGLWLRDLDLTDADFSGVELQYAKLQNINFEKANIRQSLIMQSVIVDCDFSETVLAQTCFGDTQLITSKFDGSDMLRAFLHRVRVRDCYFRKTLLENANLSHSQIELSHFQRAKLEGVLCDGSKFLGCDFSGTDLRRASFVKTELDRCHLDGAIVYGINAWDVSISDDTTQLNLVVTEDDDKGKVTVDDSRVAQFVHLIMTNSNILSVMETIGSKGVLLLGRFSEERKLLLENLRVALRERGYVPIVFDFPKPKQSDFTEVATVLASLCIFVVADITSPKSIPLELEAIVPRVMLPIIPIIQEGDDPFSMLADLQNKHDWLLDPLIYDEPQHLLSVLDAAVIAPALKKHKQVLQRKARKLGTRHVREFAAMVK